RFDVSWASPDGEAHPGPGGHPMRLATRSIAFAVVVSLLGAGPLATFARAQQAQPPAEQPTPQPEQPAQSAEQPMQASPEPGPQPAEQPAQAAPPPAPQPTAEPAQAAPPPAPQPAVQPAQMPAPPAREPQAMPEPVIFEEPSESTVGYALAATIMNFENDRRSEEHTSELQSRGHLVCRLLLEKKKTDNHVIVDAI